MTETDAGAAVYDLVVLALRELSADRELSVEAAMTLATVERLGPLRISALADRQGITQPSMTQLVQRLVNRGLLDRRPDPTDRRASLVAVTASGRTSLAERRTGSVERISALLHAAPAADVARLEAATADVLPHLRQRHMKTLARA